LKIAGDLFDQVGHFASTPQFLTVLAGNNRFQDCLNSKNVPGYPQSVLMIPE